MKSKYLTIGGLSALSVTFIMNFGFADVSTDRVDTYKANKLIPNEVQIATINSVSSDSIGIAVFSPDVLSWKSYSNVASAALGKYMDWTKEDFEAFFADPANEADFEDAWNFLSQTGNDHLQGAAISNTDAIQLLQSELDALLDGSPGRFYGFTMPVFPCEGLDFSGKDLYGIDLSKCKDMTAEQLFSSSSFEWSILPDIDFSDTIIPGHHVLFYVDFTKCTGLFTWEQLSSAQNSLEGIKLTSTQYESLKADLPNGLNLYVDGKYTTVSHRNHSGG